MGKKYEVLPLDRTYKRVDGTTVVSMTAEGYEHALQLDEAPGRILPSTGLWEADARIQPYHLCSYFNWPDDGWPLGAAAACIVRTYRHVGLPG